VKQKFFNKKIISDFPYASGNIANIFLDVTSCLHVELFKILAHQVMRENCCT